jgi:predicted dehydrogenase
MGKKKGVVMDGREAAHWINCLRTDGEVLVKPEEALIVTRILEGIYKSSQTKKPVYFS